MFLNIIFIFKISKLKYSTMEKIRKVLVTGFDKKRFIEKFAYFVLLIEECRDNTSWFMFSC